MRRSLPKVLREVAARPMVAHAIATAKAAGATRVAAVVGPNADAVAAVARKAGAEEVFVQADRLGTAHAVLRAEAAIAEGADDVVVLYGDTPLVPAETIGRVRAELAAGAAVVVLGFRTPTPKGYGRLLTDGGRLVAIREEKDASEAERAVDFCNSGIMALAGAHALALLSAIGNANAKGEYYLTDAVELAHARGLSAVGVEGDEVEVGANAVVRLGL